MRRSRKGGYRIIFQEGLKPKLGFSRGRKEGPTMKKMEKHTRKQFWDLPNALIGKTFNKNYCFSKEPSGTSESISFT